MKIVLAFVFVLFMQGPACAQSQTKLIGHFTNMVADGSDDPHFVSGYNLHLYTKDDHVFGTIAVAIGTGEPIAAELQDAFFSPATKKLSFRAEYSDGWEHSKEIGAQGRESRRILMFSGTVTTTRVVGQIVTRDRYCDGCTSNTSTVIQKRNLALDTNRFRPY